MNNYDNGNGGYGEAPAEERSIQLGELFAILFRHRLIIVVVTVFVIFATFGWVSTRTPKYEAQATLLLEVDEAAGGVLSELASLTSDPRAEAEIALLKSRSLASVTAGSPSVLEAHDELFLETAPDFDPFARTGPIDASFRQGSDPSAMENLGLAWNVERHDLQPFSAMRARAFGDGIADHRLRARIEPVGGEEVSRPASLDVLFSADGDFVTITPHEGFLLTGDEGEQRDFRPGASIEAFGWYLKLHPVGDYGGQRYRVTRLPDEKAISRLMANVTAVESGRKTNVVLVRVADSDPHRAAETANALCKNYIRRSVRIGQQKATQTVRFIDAQLAEQLEALAEAEKQVVALQTKNPETISLSTSAVALIEQLSALELEATQTDLARRVIQEALGYLDAGDFEGLARLGSEMPNLLALGYIKELGSLETESLRLERSDVLGYKTLLLGERQRVETLVEESDLRVASLRAALEDLRAGKTGAIARAAAIGTEFQGYLIELARIDGELASALGASTDSNPIVRSLEAARGELLGRLTEQVASSLEGAELAAANFQSLAVAYDESLAAWPTSERATIDIAVTELRSRVKSNLRSQVAGLADRLVALGEQKDKIEGRLGALPQSELELAEPLRQRETRGRIVEFLLTSQQEATITAAATSAAAVLIDPAVPPASRSFPQASMFLALGGLVGFLLGCGLALVHNHLRGALFTEGEVERVAGVPVMGSVPNYLVGRTKVKGAKKGVRFLPMRDAPESPQAEAYRQIRASLRLALAGDQQLRTLACTSCVPGEGKTVTNADLAMVFASAGTRVLLVDCDLRKPQIHRIFDLERGPGFGEVLEGHANWRDCVEPSVAHGLDIIPAGHCEARPGELLASDRAEPIIDELLEDYDMVVFDIPPAVVVADVANFANKLDAVMLLYRSGGVSGRLLEAVAKRMRKAGVNLMGVIVNAVVVRAVPGGYGYDYTYGYSYDYKDEQEG